MALGALVLGPSHAESVIGTPAILQITALDTTGAVQTPPSLTPLSSNAGVANPSVVGSTLSVAAVAAGVAQVWITDGGSIVSNKVIISVIDPASGLSAWVGSRK